MVREYIEAGAVPAETEEVKEAVSIEQAKVSLHLVEEYLKQYMLRKRGFK